MTEHNGKLTFAQKAAQEVEYRHQLLEDLLNGRFEYSGGPYEAHIQFSNYCNMSCIMCWDGRNPPVETSSPQLLQKISDQVAPHLSVMTPYSGSEPLVMSWNETRDMASENSVLLCLTTNAQFLDEAMFFELKDITETLIISIDSHIPEVFLKIRPGANVKKVFDNLKTTASLCRQHQLECIVNVVLLTHNAPHLVDTIEYLGNLGIETVNVIQLLDVNGRSRMIDPLLHFSHEYIDWIQKGCIEKVRSLNMRLVWSIAGCYEYDFRKPDHVQPLERKSWNDEFDQRMARTFPGFCRNVLNRLRIDAKGDIAPCCYATQGELSLGNLNNNSFAEIWNGTNARDLRRGMLSADIPSYCSTCRYSDPIGPQSDLPFQIEQDQQIQNARESKVNIETTLELLQPSHASRHEDPPCIQFRLPKLQVTKALFVFSLAGETDEMLSCQPETVETNGELCEFTIPQNIWDGLRFNAGYWWNIWVESDERPNTVFRLPDCSVLIRHQSLPRIQGSTLKYGKEGGLPIIDLGASKQLGWMLQHNVPGRPEIKSSSSKQAAQSSNENSIHQNNSKKQTSVPAGSPSSTHDHQQNKNLNVNTNSIWNRFRQLLSQDSVQERDKFNRAVVDGYIDQLTVVGDWIYMVGWILFKDGAPDKVELVAGDGSFYKARPINRPDLAANFPELETAADSGFEVKVKRDKVFDSEGYSFQLHAYRGDQVTSQVTVSVPNRESVDTNNSQGPFWFGKTEHVTIS